MMPPRNMQLNCSKVRRPPLATIRWPWSRARTSPPRIWIGSKRKSPDASDGASGEPSVKQGADGPVTDRSFVYGHAIFGVIPRRSGMDPVRPLHGPYAGKSFPPRERGRPILDRKRVVEGKRG